MKQTFRFEWLALVSLATMALASILVCEAPGQAAASQYPEDVGLPALTPMAYLPVVANGYVSPAPLWRFGAALGRRSLLDYPPEEVTRLRLGWYVDWRVNPYAPRPYGMEYVPA